MRNSETMLERFGLTKYDYWLALLIFVLFFISHQIYCQNDQGMLIYRWFESFGIKTLSQSCVSGLAVTGIRNWLPDAIWSMMLGLILARVWLDSLGKWWVCASIILSGSGFELLQLGGFAKGTFDRLDLLVSLIASTGAVALIRLVFKKTMAGQAENKGC